MNIGYSVNYCSKLLKNRLNKELETEGITDPRMETLIKLAKGLEITLDELVKK